MEEDIEDWDGQLCLYRCTGCGDEFTAYRYEVDHNPEGDCIKSIDYDEEHGSIECGGRFVEVKEIKSSS